MTRAPTIEAAPAARFRRRSRAFLSTLGLVGLLSAVVASGVTSGAAAQAGTTQPPSTEMDSIARKHFETGLSYYELGDFDGAIVEFDKAYDLSQRPALLYNLSLAHEKVGRYGDAADALGDYLEHVDDAERRASLLVRLSMLRERAAEQQQRVQAEAEAAPPRAAAPVEVTTSEPAPARDDPRRLRRNPWLWTAVGVVVVGIVAGAAAAGRSPRTRTAEPFQEGTILNLPGPEVAAR